MPDRTRADACPGVFAPHDAADGALARVRLPGGTIRAAAMRVVASCAEDLGDGNVHLTARGNLQLRGLRRDGELARRLGAAGLLPSASHERVRNVLASPLSTAARTLAARLDRELCARPVLAGLSGRFLFAIDDGCGDVAAEEPDLCWRAGRLVAGGHDLGAPGEAADPVAVLVAAAEAFLRVKADHAWRVRDDDAVPGRIAEALRPDGAPASDFPSLRAWTGPTGTPHAAVPGPARLDDGRGALVVAPVLGELTAAQLTALADTGAAEAVVTPWRTIVVVEPMQDTMDGLVTDPRSAVPLVSVCAGLPGCAKSLTDVRSDAREATATADTRIHIVGCERRCGAPRTAHVEWVARPGGGYEITEVGR